MYDDHYGLSGRPFQLTPDPRFWFDTATHRKAMAYLGYGLAQGEGFIVITGDVGAGKTTLVGHLMDTVDPTRLHVIKIVSTQIEAEDLLRMVAGGLDIDSADLSKAQLLVAIERGLHATARAGRRTLLIVDEAQALPVSSLEELRMLSNFQTGGHALLQIFLLGQPEFRERLHGSDRLEQLRQRVIAMHHLDPMEREEVEPYMRHRLSVVGWNDRPNFTPDAYVALYAGSDGVPRRLNQLAGRVLLFGAIEQLDTIDGRAVATVVSDIAGDMPGVKPIEVPEVFAAEPKFEPDAITEPEPFVEDDFSIPPIMVLDEAPVTEAEATPVMDHEAKDHEAIDHETVDHETAVDAHPTLGAAGPLPMAHMRPPSDPRPIRAVHEAPPFAVEAGPVAEPDAAPLHSTTDDRIAALEARLDEQDVALRRVLTLLVDWAEGEQGPNFASARAAGG